MSRPLVFMFSGQGSHFYGMAAELYRENAVFRDTLDRLSRQAEPVLGPEGLIRLIYQPLDRRMPFERTLHTHPALYAIQYSLARTLIAAGIEPNYLLGYSLGEYVALAVSQAISMEAGMDMILAQAEALERWAEPATMIAVLGNVAILQADPYLFRGTWTAAVNYDRHFVLTGPKPLLEELNESLFEREITAQILAVSHGFHSPLVDPAREAFRAHAAGMQLREPLYPLYSSMRQERLERVDADYLWSVCRNPVGFRETVRRLESRAQPLYIDLGPSGTLANFTRALLGDPERSVATINQWGHDLKALEQLRARLERG